MVRIEKNARIEKRLNDVKGGVVEELHHRTRKKRPWFACLMIFMLVLVGLLVWGTWEVAATGLIRVPVFTSIAYKVPGPIREVTPGVPAETVLKQQLSATLARGLYEGGGELKDRSLSVALSEQTLSASLRTFLEKSGLDWIDASGAQIVIDPEFGVEVYAPFSGKLNSLDSAVIARFAISAENGKVVVIPEDIFLGATRVPDLLVASFLKPFLESELARLNADVVGYAKISTIELFERKLVVTGELAVEIQE